MNADRGSAGALLRTFLVERYWPGVTVDAFTDAVERVRKSTERMRGEGAAIRTISSTLVPSDEAAYWVVEAPSIDLVELAYARAGVPVERIVGAFEGERPMVADERPLDHRAQAADQEGSRG